MLQSNPGSSSLLSRSFTLPWSCLIVMVSLANSAAPLALAVSALSLSTPADDSYHTHEDDSLSVSTSLTTTTTIATKATSSESNSSSSLSRKVYGKDDALFGCIEDQQGNHPFGRFLDAGTGLHSLRWIASLCTDNDKGLTQYTAITADETMRANVQKEAKALGIEDFGEVVIGNWFHKTKPLVYPPESFDTILVDYLIGSMDGFSPFEQDQIIPKLTSILTPGGRLYIVGLEPIPDAPVPPMDDPSAQVICRVRQVRDACILLAGHRCYREYPLNWLTRHIRERIPDLEVLDVSTFRIRYRHETILRQISVGRNKLPLMPSALRVGMTSTLDELEEQSLQATVQAGGRLSLGFDYVISTAKQSNGLGSNHPIIK